MKISFIKHIVFPLALAALWVGIFKITFDYQYDEASSEALTQEQRDQIRDLQARYGGTPRIVPPRQTFSGSYLAGLFAQRRHDWESSYLHMQDALKKLPEDQHALRDTLSKRAIILGVGSGYYDEAFQLSAQLPEDGRTSLSQLFLVVEAFKKNDFDTAIHLTDTMPKGSVADFILPLLSSWAKASQGKLDIAALSQNVMHAYHGVLITDYLKKDQRLGKLLDEMAKKPGNQVLDFERVADAYTHIQNHGKALEFYQKILQAAPHIERIQDKATAIKSGDLQDYFTPTTLPEHGIAQALYDMALVLYQEYSDESARVFSHLALYLDPSITEVKILLANIAARSELYAEAISYYSMVPDDNEYFEDSRLRIAGFLEKMERFDAAVSELSALHESRDSLKALIQMGDMERRRKNFPDAIQTYSKAAAVLGSKIPEDYWTLLYVRGMAYEQNGQWDEAEADLKAALEYRPNDPYILNYLGYAWIDQGHNLEESLEMIQRALSLEPGDGYITDSLGWAYYQTGDYSKALPYLEKAAELQPYDPVINDHLGDAYWKLGRKLEARFQWTRAKNHGEEQDLLSSLEDKLIHGLKIDPASIQEAKSTIDNAEDTHP